MAIQYLTKTVLALTMAGSLMAAGLESSSIALKAALDRSPAESYQCLCSIDCSGKTQLAACLKMAELLEQELSENEGVENVPLSDVFKGFIGLNTGALPAAAIALGQNASAVCDILPKTSSKLITPKGVSCCLGCLGTSTKMANYFIDGDVDPMTEAPRTENNYDAIKLDSNAITAISNVTSGGEVDLRSCLTVLSTSESTDFSEQVLAAIQESDNATKENAVKIAFNTIMEAAKTATSVAIAIGGEKINKSSAEKALDIMTKIDETAVGEALENTFFKRNLAQNLAHPSSDSPLFILNLKAETTTDRAVKTFYDQEIGDNFVEVTYTARIPIGAYPGGKVSFDLAKSNVESSVFNCMQNIRLDSAKSTDIVADFLTASKLAKIRNRVAISPSEYENQAAEEVSSTNSSDEKDAESE